MPRGRVKQKYCKNGHLLAETAFVRVNGKRSCRECQKNRREELKKRPKTVILEKQCSRCKIPKPLEEFYCDATKLDGRACYCKRCERWVKLLHNYGVTEDEYIALALAQNGFCAICGHFPQPSEPFLVVDHDHDTQAVRGLLCRTCNTAIGMLHDEPLLVKKALEYLE